MKNQAKASGIKVYLALVTLLLAIIIFISSISGGSILSGNKDFLDLAIFGSKVFQIRELFELLGGLGLFLFGIKFMGEGLQLSAGDKIKYYITKFTDNPIKGFILGLVVTGLIQSSSGTTALVVALVSVGLMSFRQSMAVIIGSNLGTTVTSILIGLKIKNYVWMIIALGGLLYMFAKKKKTRYIAQTILGFGILFLGMKYMGGAMKPLAKEEWFKNLLVQMDSGKWYSSWLGMLVSAFLTVLVQSSSASIGIIQTLHADHLLTGSAAIPMIFGANIGTTITAILASLGVSLYAKRTALFHTIFNVFGAIIFILLLPFVKPIFILLAGEKGLNSAALIPTTHVLFNLTMAIIVLPFLPGLEKLIKWIIKKSSSDDEVGIELLELNTNLIEASSTLAVENIQSALGRLVKLVNKQTELVYQLFKHGNKKTFTTIYDIFLSVDQYNVNIISFLEQIGAKQISDEDQKQVTHLTLITRDITRINKLNFILAEIAAEMKGKKIKFSEESYQEMKVLFKLAIKVGLDLSTLLENSFNKEVYDSLIQKEDKINDFQKRFKKNHILRVKQKLESSGSKYFDEVITRIERLADHHKMAAQFLAPDETPDGNELDQKLIQELLLSE